MRHAVVSRLTVECHGALLSLEPADTELLDAVAPLLPSAAVVPTTRADAAYVWRRESGGVGRPLHVIALRGGEATAASTEVARTRDVGEAAARLAHDAEFRVALHARGRLFVHAAAVAWRGRGILVPGRSFSGKSTLAAALVRAGARYLSDEFAVLDEEGQVHPFPRRLRLRANDGRELLTTVSAEQLGGTTATRPVPVGLVVWTTYRAGARWRPRAMTAGRTALALLDNTVVAQLRPAYALRVIARALGGATGLRGARGDADATAHAILARAGS